MWRYYLKVTGIDRILGYNIKIPLNSTRKGFPSFSSKNSIRMSTNKPFHKRPCSYVGSMHMCTLRLQQWNSIRNLQSKFLHVALNFHMRFSIDNFTCMNSSTYYKGECPFTRDSQLSALLISVTGYTSTYETTLWKRSAEWCTATNWIT